MLVREPQHWARCTLPPSSGSTARSFPGKINIKCLSGSSCDDDPYFIISFHNLICSSTTPLLEHITNKSSKTRWVVGYFTSTRLMSSSRKLSSFCSCSSCCKQNRKTYKCMWDKENSYWGTVLIEHWEAWYEVRGKQYLSLVSPCFFEKLHEYLSLGCLRFLVATDIITNLKKHSWFNILITFLDLHTDTHTFLFQVYSMSEKIKHDRNANKNRCVGLALIWMTTKPGRIWEKKNQSQLI